MAQTSGRIVSTPSVLGGKPRVDGTRIGVYFLHQQVEERGLDPEAVAAEYDLDVADVYHALAYFHDHPEEMAEVEERRERARQRAEADDRIATGPDDRDATPQ